MPKLIWIFVTTSVRLAFVFSGPLLTLAWLAGWWANDRWPHTLWLFFIPAPFVLCAGVAWLLLTFRSPRRMLRIVVLLGCLLAAFKIAALDMAWPPRQPPPEDGIRVVHWNTARGVFGVAGIFRALLEDQPDICVLSEPPGLANLDEMGARRFGTRYMFQDAGMALLSRYPIVPIRSLAIANGRAWVTRIETPQGALDLLSVDLISHPHLDRRLPMRDLNVWIKERDPAAPLLVVGDFNTPRDADSLQLLRQRLRHAYEAAGRGWPYTWPMPAPVYALDHAWFSPGIRVHDYRLRRSGASDHLRQVFVITLSPTPGANDTP